MIRQSFPPGYKRRSRIRWPLNLTATAMLGSFVVCAVLSLLFAALSR